LLIRFLSLLRISLPLLSLSDAGGEGATALPLSLSSPSPLLAGPFLAIASVSSSLCSLLTSYSEEQRRGEGRRRQTAGSGVVAARKREAARWWEAPQWREVTRR
ncbi:unnamed protein product, partial [Urochloa humidicola]